MTEFDDVKTMTKQGRAKLVDTLEYQYKANDKTIRRIMKAEPIDWTWVAKFAEYQVAIKERLAEIAAIEGSN